MGEASEISLTRATAATAHEPMLTPGHLGNAVGHRLVIDQIASAA